MSQLHVSFKIRYNKIANTTPRRQHIGDKPLPDRTIAVLILTDANTALGGDELNSILHLYRAYNI